MLEYLKMFWKEAPTTTLICTAILTVFGVILLYRGGDVASDIYLNVYTSMGGSLLAFFAAISAASGIAILTVCVFLAGFGCYYVCLAILVLLKI